jgi:nitrate reductase beta subunit
MNRITKTLIAATLAAATFPAVALDGDSLIDFCTSMSGSAEAIMKARQTGVPMSTMIERATNGLDNELLRSMYQKIVIAAYNERGYITESMQERIIAEFRDLNMAECMKAFSE